MPPLLAEGTSLASPGCSCAGMLLSPYHSGAQIELSTRTLNVRPAVNGSSASGSCWMASIIVPPFFGPAAVVVPPHAASSTDKPSTASSPMDHSLRDLGISWSSSSITDNESLADTTSARFPHQVNVGSTIRANLSCTTSPVSHISHKIEL